MAAVLAPRDDRDGRALHDALESEAVAPHDLDGGAGRLPDDAGRHVGDRRCDERTHGNTLRAVVLNRHQRSVGTRSRQF